MSSVVGDSQIFIALIPLAMNCSEPYFARCCTLKQTGTGTFALASKVICLV